jgi:16S rRNA processing protein RimM
MIIISSRAAGVRYRRINPSFLFLASLFMVSTVRVYGFVVTPYRRDSSCFTITSIDRKLLQRNRLVSPSSLRSFETRLWKSAEPYNTPEQTANTRKKKKNKYAKFSKADKIELDPFEALIKESEQKLQSIELEKTELEKTKRAPLPPPPEASTKTLEFPNNKDIDPYDPTSFGFVEIGSILGPHGVHGWVKVAGCTDFPERLTRAGIPLHMKPVRKRAPRKVTLAAGKFLGDDQFLIQLQGYYDRTASQTLKGSTLYFATQQDSVEREDDEIVLNELIGLSVYRTTDVDGEEGLVGTILGVVLAEEMCAIPGLLHDQLEVGVTRKSSSEEPDAPPGSLQDLLLIPLVPEIVTKIDLENHMILVDPPAGLLDLTYVREEKVKLKGLLAPAKE